jgi:predicted RNA-binding protein with PUA domain
MSCEHLVCASCAHPVSEARCSVCQASRDHVHASGAAGLVPALTLLLAVLVLAAIVAAHLG